MCSDGPFVVDRFSPIPVDRGLKESHFRGPLGARCCGRYGARGADLRVAGFGFEEDPVEALIEISRCVCRRKLH